MEFNDDDYIISRRFIYGLEFVKSEMEMKVTEAKRKNKDFDSTDAELKIKAVAKAENYLYILYEELVKMKKKNYELEFLTRTLIAEKLKK